MSILFSILNRVGLDSKNQDAKGLAPVPREEGQAVSVFDNMTRSLAGSTTRRDVLKISIFGLASVVLSTLGVRRVWGGDTCLCDGLIYDPVTACCTPTGLQQKNPIVNLAACPDRTARPGFVCTANGCGAEGGTSFPGSFGSANFLDCCNTHDCCYATCENTQATCDSNFETCLEASCQAAYADSPVRRNLCFATANTYASAVENFGADAWAAAQRQSCDCCGPEPCDTGCAGSACGSLPECAPGLPCVCFTSVEGPGACIDGSTPCSSVTNCTSTQDCPAGTICVTTSCCGSEGVCGPLCSFAASRDGGSPVDGPIVVGTGELSKPKPYKTLGGL